MNEANRLDRSDQIGMYLSIVLVAIGVIIAVVPSVHRLIEVGSGTDVPVTVPLSGEAASLPLGPDGAMVSATVDTATVVVADPAPATLFALYAQPIWTILMVLTVGAFATMFFLRLARGRTFQRGTSKRVYLALSVLLFGWFVGGLLTNMTTNGALSAISDYTYDSVTFETSLLPFFVFLVLAGFAAALQIGERLQRETEGLV
jgi:hypothetical protein